MNIESGLAVFAILLAVHSGIGVLLGCWSITMPIVFVIIGMLIGPYGFGLLPIKLGDEPIRVLTELTLALLSLFVWTLRTAISGVVCAPLEERTSGCARIGGCARCSSSK